ncbi:Transmembrane and coiled-coil domain protein 3 [Collichthys lucidus]|uniref:Transmembrane and coiled-coil domain protein 3 n=1 Tax=Collichthys lucidus TaxID=240159 RepID=A0A4U5VRL6_COLLU|nr:Transmembrane and coiled-coil domain protein 3 [Collichthys lucidus]
MRRFTVLSLFPRGDGVDEDGDTEDDQLTVSFYNTTSVSVFNRHEVASAERSNCDVNILSIPVPIRRGGSESNLDVVDSVGNDGVGLDFTKGALGIDSLQQKILKDSETNGKHTHKDGGNKESGTHSKEGSLRDVSATGRHPALDKVKTIGPGVSLSPPFFFNKSREIANLIRNKFGSADNIAHLKSSMESGSGLQVDPGARGLSGSANTVAKTTKYQSDDECSTGTSASADSNGNLAGGSGTSGDPGRSDSNGRLGEVLDMVREIREAQAQLAEDMETLNSQFKRDYSYFTQMMQEERYSRLHLALTCVGVSVLALLWKNWEHLQCALERFVLPP